MNIINLLNKNNYTTNTCCVDMVEKLKRGHIKTISVPEKIYEELKELKYELKVDTLYEAISKLIEEHRDLSEIRHINTYEDHITLMHKGRVFNVYLQWKQTKMGRRLGLWCELDESNDCIHVKYCWWNEKIKKSLLEIMEKGRTDPVPGDV